MKKSFSDFPTLSHDTLELMPPLPADAAHLYRLYRDPKVYRYLDRIPPADVDECQRLINRMVEENTKGTSFYWTVRKEGFFAGVVRITAINRKHSFATIGYELLPEHWSRGIMQQALRTALGFLFTFSGLYRIEAQTHTSNAKSIALLERLGFTREGRLRGNFVVEGERGDSFLYALTRPEFKH